MTFNYVLTSDRKTQETPEEFNLTDDEIYTIDINIEYHKNILGNPMGFLEGSVFI
jgi:hypothetical protein